MISEACSRFTSPPFYDLPPVCVGYPGACARNVMVRDRNRPSSGSVQPMGRLKCVPMGSMGLVFLHVQIYIYLHEWLIFMVVKCMYTYTPHGSYGCSSRCFFAAKGY